MAPPDFVAHLRKQFGYLERSCASYDGGCYDEAIRMATVIRVLVHNTKSSTSLLKHLNATTINLRSTARGSPAQARFYMGLGLIHDLNGRTEYLPKLGRGSSNSLVPLSEWWDQVVMVLEGHRISRRDIVLAAADKDGGAHVDKKLTVEYEALAKDGAVGAYVYESQGAMVEAPIEGAHLMALRQIAYEILNSPELRELL